MAGASGPTNQFGLRQFPQRLFNETYGLFNVFVVCAKPEWLKRMEESASSALSPIALSTCDGSGIPDVQAEPVEAARRG